MHLRAVDDLVTARRAFGKDRDVTRRELSLAIRPAKG